MILLKLQKSKMSGEKPCLYKNAQETKRELKLDSFLMQANLCGSLYRIAELVRIWM